MIKYEPNGTTLSERIKSSITVHDFISQYVELSPIGRGLCPFHEDHVRSFAVNFKGNYWNCFAGCGGGSIIDFWMKRQKCDFVTAVRELTKMLL
jgi:DNA primase